MSYIKDKVIELKKDPESAALYETALILQQLHDLREELGLTQAQVAERLGVSQARVNQIERKRNKPSFDVIVKLAHSLGAEIILRKIP